MRTFPLYESMIHDMTLHGYGERTREAYSRAVRQMWEFLGVALEEITEEQLRQYFLHRKNKDKWSSATMRIAYAGIKFFFEHTMRRDWHTLSLIRAEAERKLPVVLSIEEVRSILAHFRTPQNKAYFTAVYSCGLRLLEGLNLQVPDVDSHRMLLHVHRGKGAKDRYVPRPESTLEVLRAYWKQHRNPLWLFPSLGRGGRLGPIATMPMAKQTVQGALRRVLRELPQIKKPVRVHTFRHSYATHLLEAGVNIRLVQQFLGHASLTSTMVYAHVTRSGHDEACERINVLMQGVAR
jgi:integrase/recombinase XerD